MIIYVITYKEPKKVLKLLILIFNELLKFKTSNGNIERRRALLWTVMASTFSLPSYKVPFAFVRALLRSSDQKIIMKSYLILRTLHRTRKIFLKIILRPCKINLLM